MTDAREGERLIVKESPGRGRGVFAGEDFDQGDVIEVCPVIVLPPDQRVHVRVTTLGRYSFNWPGGTAIVLGYGALINHSSTPNSLWRTDVDDNVMLFLAMRAIAKGEEITHDYGRANYHPGSVDSPPWWTQLNLKHPIVYAGGAVVGIGVAGLLRRRIRGQSGVGR